MLGTGRRVSSTDVERVAPFEVLIDRRADECTSRWIATRRHLHAHPEASGDEVETTQFVARKLTELGLDVQIPARGLGVIADLKVGDPAESPRVVAVRADMDALRMADRKTVPWASTCPGLAHACGHDVHTTVILAVAELAQHVVQTHRDELPNLHLRFLFQAAEETCDGASWMIEDGALRDVTTILGLHVDPLIRAGRVGIRYGVLTAQVDEVHFRLQGRGGHTARPHHTTDPVAAAALLISSLHQALTRHADALHPSVFTLGMIHGGTAPNVVPDAVDFAGTLRCTDRRTRDDIHALMLRCCDSVGAISGNTVSCEFRTPLGSVVNDVTVASAMEEAATLALGSEQVQLLDKPSMGGEDFAMYIEQVRGAQIRLGCAGETSEQSPWPLLHSPDFDIDESAIRVGARVLTRAALLLAMMPRG